MIRRGGRWLGASVVTASCLWVAQASSAPMRPIKRPAGVSANAAQCQAVALPQRQDKLPFGPGEALSYVAVVNGVQAGKANLKMEERTNKDGRVVYPAVVVAESNPVVKLWAQMSAELITVLDPDRTVPLSMRSITKSDKHVYEEDIHFDLSSKKVNARTTLNGKSMDQQLQADVDALDALSLLYYARSRAVDVGQAFCLDLYQSRLLWRIQGVVERKETLETDAGPFETIKATGTAVAQLGALRAQPAILKEPRPFEVWMTADEDRIPVLLKAPTPLGDVTVKLVRFEQGRRLVRAR